MALRGDDKGGLGVELLETRHVRDAFKVMPVKTDRKDARGIAQLTRLGWFRPVHCKSMSAQEVRALLTARKLVQSKLFDIEMILRGILREFGLKVGARQRVRMMKLLSILSRYEAAKFRRFLLSLLLGPPGSHLPPANCKNRGDTIDFKQASP
jgi:transposase